MDGNKKLKGIFIAGLIALTFSACKVQPHGYGGLYVENMQTDTKAETNWDQAKITATDTAVSKQANLKTTKSIYDKKDGEASKSLTDSVQLLRNQVAKLQKQFDKRKDSIYIEKKTSKPATGDSLQRGTDFRQMFQDKNDSISILRNQINEIEKLNGSKSDTMYMAKEIVKLISYDSIHSANQIIPRTQVQMDTVVENIIPQQKSQKTQFVKPATVSEEQKSIKNATAQNNEIDDLRAQQLKAKDQEIRMLQRQVQSLQNANARTPQQRYTTQQPVQQAVPISSQQSKEEEFRRIQAQQDTIHLLKQQLRQLQPQQSQQDTVIIEKNTQQPRQTSNLSGDQQASELSSNLQDTLQVLKSRLLSLEEQSLRIQDAPSTEQQTERVVAVTEKVDTTLIVAYYGRNQIKPLEQESILNQVKELSKKQVLRTTLSGFTDSTGDEAINEQITTSRINFLSEMIYPWIPKEKVFFQNFGQTFASERMVSYERRIEIEILTQ